MKRYLFIGRFAGFAGGIERYAWAAAKSLASRGCEVAWVGTEAAPDAELFRSAFARVYDAVPADGDWDEVVIHKLPPAGVIRALKSRFGARLVFFAHDHDLYCPRRHYYTPFGRANCQRAYSPLRCLACALASSPRNAPRVVRNFLAPALRELATGRARVISGFMKANLVKNGFDPAKIELAPVFLPEARPLRRYVNEGHAIRLLFAGQLIAGKGCDFFLDTLARLGGLGTSYTATVLGDGKDRERLVARAFRDGLTVRFAGWRSDPERYFAASDLTLFTSRWQEPYGLVGAESIARGTPVAAFDVGGVREWLKPRVNGILVKAGDTAALADAVAAFSSDGSLERGIE